MNNDRFTIPKPLPIASKRRVTHYPRVTKKKNKNGQRLQPSIKQARCFYEFKRIHLCGAHLGLLPQTPPDGLHLFHLYLYLFWWGSCLGVTLVSISISTFSIVPAYSTPFGYVHKFWLCIGFVPAYSIPRGYAHKWPWCSNLQGSPWWKIH